MLQFRLISREYNKKKENNLEKKIQRFQRQNNNNSKLLNLIIRQILNRIKKYKCRLLTRWGAHAKIHIA